MTSDVELPQDLSERCAAIMTTMEGQQALLRDCNPVILDLTVREPAVGIPQGHTPANKLELFEIVKDFGFTDILLATFDVGDIAGVDEPQADDVFCQALVDRGEDLTGCFAFTTIGSFDGETFVPDKSMIKQRDFGVPNTIVDLDIAPWNRGGQNEADYTRRLVASIDWFADNLQGDGGGQPRIYINYQDGVDAFFDDWRWIARLTRVLGEHPAVTAVTYEDGKGTAMPFQIGALTRLIKAVAPDKLALAHMHAGSGFENANLIEALLAGADGVWAGLTREAATIGHAPTCEFLANLARLGNQSVRERFPLDKLGPRVNEVTQINTGAAPPADFPIFGADAYRTMLSFFNQWYVDGEDKLTRQNDLMPEELGIVPGWRIAPVVAGRDVVRGRLLEVDPTIDPTLLTDALLDKMRAMMRTESREGIRVAYDDPAPLLDLLQRAGAA